MNKLFLILRVIPKLGIKNFLYMIWYRFSLRFGFRKKKFPIGQKVNGPFYILSDNEEKNSKIFLPEWKKSLLEKSDNILNGNFYWFSHHKFNMGTTPNWFKNPFDNSVLNDPTLHWLALNDFTLNTGDVKIIWELSRFDWLVTLARAASVDSSKKNIDRINLLLEDWSKQNPLNQGPNWKCGQETSIRIFNLFLTSLILDQHLSSSDSLMRLVKDHLKRVCPNINYAIAQDNNHGTSEASGIYLACMWLTANGEKEAWVEKWKNKSRKILEERILHLIQKDGNFAQRSMTYHRVAVDTMTFLLIAMKTFKEPDFNNEILDRLQKLGEWQYKMTLGSNGDAPNYGSNDGAMFNQLHHLEYRDFRPSTQAFFAALLNKKVYTDPTLDESLFWLLKNKSIELPLLHIETPKEELLDNQLLILRNKKATLVVKIPEDRFRPGNDAAHVDLWVNGKNILRDNGSYSYNDKTLTDYFKSSSAHNTICFGQHNQMPKISRFLNGTWIKAENITKKSTDKELNWSFSYTDYKNNFHQRTVTLTDECLKIKDQIKSLEKATINFHLTSDNLEDNVVIVDIDKYQIDKSYQSLYYLQKNKDQKISTAIDSESLLQIQIK